MPAAAQTAERVRRERQVLLEEVVGMRQELTELRAQMIEVRGADHTSAYTVLESIDEWIDTLDAVIGDA